MKIQRMVWAAALAVLAVAGCGGGPKPMTVHGTLVLKTTSLAGDGDTAGPDLKSGDACKGLGGFDDIKPGAQVTVTDEASKVVGVGSLGGGKYDSSSGDCTFTFTVDGVKAGHPFYGVEVSHRGVVRFQGASVESASLTLGDS